MVESQCNALHVRKEVDMTEAQYETCQVDIERFQRVGAQ